MRKCGKCSLYVKVKLYTKITGNFSTKIVNQIKMYHWKKNQNYEKIPICPIINAFPSNFFFISPT